MLTPEDISQLKHALKPKERGSEKIAIALITFALIGLITYVFSGIQTLKDNDSNQTKDIEFVKISIAEIKEFTRQPRFTADDAKGEHDPMLRRLDKVEAKLDDREGFMDRTQERLSKLEYQNERNDNN